MRLRILGAAPIVAAAILSVSGHVAWGQNNCRELRAVMPWRLGFTATTPSIFAWNGPTYISIGAEEALISDYVLAPGPPPDQRRHGVIGMDRGLTGKWDFGSHGTVTFDQQSPAVYQAPPGNVIFGIYRTTFRISGGTGRFAQVSGTFVERGPYMVWFESPSDTWPQGRYLAEITGTICGVLPR